MAGLAASLLTVHVTDSRAVMAAVELCLTRGRLANGEFRGGARRRLSVDARQRRPNQRAVHRTFLLHLRDNRRIRRGLRDVLRFH